MRKLLAPMLALALVLAGCGDDGGDDDGGGGEAAAEAPVLDGAVNDEGTADATGDDAEVEIAVGSNSFSPTFVQATPGATVSVTVTNDGSGSHTFTIDEAGVDQELSAGTDTTVDVTVPDGGTLVFYCRFHRGAGMQGAFFSAGGAGAGAGETTTTPTADDPGLDY